MISVSNVNILLGEKRRIFVDISSTNKEDFIIRNAKYKLYEQNQSEVEAEGDCGVEEHTISVFIEPLKRKTYVLEFSMEIAEEIVKKKVLVNVL